MKMYLTFILLHETCLLLIGIVQAYEIIYSESFKSSFHLFTGEGQDNFSYLIHVIHVSTSDVRWHILLSMQSCFVHR